MPDYYGLLGPDDPNDVGLLGSALVSPQMQKQALALAALQAGGQMLAAPRGTTTGQALGAGLALGAPAYLQNMSALGRQAALAQRAQDIRDRRSAQSTLSGGTDPRTGIHWNTGRPGMTTDQRMGLIAQAYPEEYGRQLLQQEFANPTALSNAIKQRDALPNDSPDREHYDNYIRMLTTPGGRLGPQVRLFYDEETHQPYKAQYDPATGQWIPIGGTKAPPVGAGKSGPKTSTFYDSDTGQPYRAVWDEASGKYVREGGTKAPTPGRGGLSVAQERWNTETDEARAQLEAMGLSRDEFARRTMKVRPESGLSNPDYDPRLGSLAAKALRPKNGDDPEYSTFSSRYFADGTFAPPRSPESPRPPAGVPGAGPSGGAASLPLGANGRPDPMRLKNGQLYTLPNGEAARWDSKSQKFVTDN